jgi:hypothetical protein
MEKLQDTFEEKLDNLFAEIRNLTKEERIVTMKGLESISELTE